MDIWVSKNPKYHQKLNRERLKTSFYTLAFLGTSYAGLELEVTSINELYYFHGTISAFSLIIVEDLLFAICLSYRLGWLGLELKFNPTHNIK